MTQLKLELMRDAYDTLGRAYLTLDEGLTILSEMNVCSNEHKTVTNALMDIILVRKSLEKQLKLLETIK